MQAAVSIAAEHTEGEAAGEVGVAEHVRQVEALEDVGGASAVVVTYQSRSPPVPYSAPSGPPSKSSVLTETVP